jgi:hypothetical protein
MNSPVAASFIDFKKAFDCLHRQSLWSILLDFGIPSKFVNIIQKFYSGAKSCVRTEVGQTEWFEVLTGVRQGCILSPLLFAIVMDWIMRKATTKCSSGLEWRNGSHMSDLDFVDDVTLLAASWDKLQMLNNAVESEASKIGLVINSSKTKFMALGAGLIGSADMVAGGQKIEVVESFNYLGSIVTCDGQMDKEIISRIGKASAAFGSMTSVWRNNKLNLCTKLRLYNAIIIPTVSYASETWALKINQQAKLDAFDSGCLRRILGINWRDHITNLEVRSRTGQELLSVKIRRRRLRWLGHLLHMPEHRLPKQVLDWTPPGGARKRGRPRMDWRGTVDRDIKDMNSNWSEVEAMAQDRVKWQAWSDLCAVRLKKN